MQKRNERQGTGYSYLAIATGIIIIILARVAFTSDRATYGTAGTIDQGLQYLGISLVVAGFGGRLAPSVVGHYLPNSETIAKIGKVIAESRVEVVVPDDEVVKVEESDRQS